jgi:YgiT-type zinc finger domain-containing protein
MTSESADPYRQAQRELANWQSTHPQPTFAEIEAAVEEQIAHVRAQLIAEQTTTGFSEEHPLCRECGATMVRHAQSTRTLLLPHDEPLELERSYLVCPQCGAGLFPPG